MTFAANVGTFSTLPFSTCFVFPLAAHAVYQAFANLQKPIVGLIWSLNCRKCITSQVSAQGGFEKKIEKSFWRFLAPFLGPRRNPLFYWVFGEFAPSKPLLRSVCPGNHFARRALAPARARITVRRSPTLSPSHPLRATLPIAICDATGNFCPPRVRPPPVHLPSHCALRYLSQYVTQRATSARRACALPLCTFPAIARYVTYRNM